MKARPPNIPTISAAQGWYSSHPAHIETMPVSTPLRVNRKLHFLAIDVNLHMNNTDNPPPQPPIIVLTIAVPTLAASVIPLSSAPVIAS